MVESKTQIFDNTIVYLNDMTASSWIDAMAHETKLVCGRSEGTASSVSSRR